ncbi:MAG: hypothetical protein JWR80_1695 [Bradyrhizobium sp.]|nr:hypothetical protein [Bradyrhizobium sp.]
MTVIGLAHKIADSPERGAEPFSPGRIKPAPTDEAVIGRLVRPVGRRRVALPKSRCALRPGYSLSRGGSSIRATPRDRGKATANPAHLRRSHDQQPIHGDISSASESIRCATTTYLTGPDPTQSNLPPEASAPSVAARPRTAMRVPSNIGFSPKRPPCLWQGWLPPLLRSICLPASRTTTIRGSSDFTVSAFGMGHSRSAQSGLLPNTGNQDERRLDSICR